MSPFLKALYDSNIEIILEYHGDYSSQPDVRFEHEYLGEITFPDISQFAIDELVDEVIELKANISKAKDDDSTFENNRVG